jgi:signal transduction histidine kinase/DNA-binding response OmpR family regulator
MAVKPAIYLISLLIGLCTWVEAQPYVAWVKHYAPEDGLAHREVNAIFQDRQGFMWFGTKFGLSRFDGKTFTTFTKDRNGLDFDDIHAIAQDANGLLWLMGPYHESRIALFNPLTSKPVAFNDILNVQQDTAFVHESIGLVSGHDGTIFLTNFRSAKLTVYQPIKGKRSVALPQFKSLGSFQSTDKNTVWCIADDRHIVELTPDGRVLHQFSHGQGDQISWHFGQRNAGIEFFYSVYNPVKGGKRLFYSVDEQGRRQQWPSALIDAMARYAGAVCYPLNRDGLLWDGITLRDSTNRTLLSITDQTAGETIENRSFFRDRSGLLWLGTSFGVYQVKLTPNYFHRLFYQPGNKGDQVAAIRGITVLGDQVYANQEKFGLYTVPQQGGIPKKISGNRFFAYGLAKDQQGKLYKGDVNQVVNYDPSSGNATTISLPIDSEAWALYPLSADQWLVGTPKGLRLMDTKKQQAKLFGQYNQFAELAQGHILHIAPDRQGTLWICASTGLYTIDPIKGITARYWSGGKGRFHLPADNYQHFYADKQGIYWLATGNAGLIRWDRRTHLYRQFRRSEGLSNDNIYAVYADGRGHLWLSSDYGIMQFDPIRLTTRTYFVQDGITHNEFNRIAHAQDKAGRIYFGGLNGITTFDPQDFAVEPPPAPLPIQLVSFRQFDQASNKLIDKTEELAQTHQLVMRPGDQTSVVEFALLNFTDGEKNVYAYQFKGLDNVWTQQTESSLRLGNLPYGEYELLIKGQAANGQWSSNVLTIAVDVQRPFYLKGWFLVLSLLLVIAGIWGWLKWRIWNHQQERKRLQTEINQATARIEADKNVIEQQAQALYQLNETKSRFFANISHEFRTPLTVILGMTSELKRYSPDELAQHRQRVANLIERNGSNLLRLVNQILDLSKLEAGEMYLQPIQADLVSFARYVSESFHTMAFLKNVEMHFLADSPTLETDFDKDKLQDILSNLLTNALKFTPAGGQIFLTLSVQQGRRSLANQGYYEEVVPTQQWDAPWILIQVRDTGSGIEADQLPLIFNRFFQGSADAGSTNSVSGQPGTEIGGTGIGLSLVRELILLMNGGLAVRSQPGQGTEFVISLRHTRQALSVPLPVVEPIRVHPDRVEVINSVADQLQDKPMLLLVEDNEDVAAYITSCLQADYQISRVDNGQQGIDQAFETIPDLIVSDVMMPLKDGFQLCDTLKNDERTSHIPIVLLTARAAVTDRIAGLRRGADAYLTKPFQREELDVVLTNLLKSRRILQIHYSQQLLQTTRVDQPVDTESDSLEDQFLHKLRVVLEPQLENSQLSIDELCQQIGLSRSTLHRKLVGLTGMSIIPYIRVIRLGKAKELLISSDLNISEVAYAVGFEDPKYFSRQFSEEFGLSPAKFRLVK